MKKKQAYTDSIKQVQYDYIFPILGQKVYKAGFDIPYPVGIMGNFMWMKQGILIDNMQLGLKTDTQDIPLTNVDEFIKYLENKKGGVMLEGVYEDYPGTYYYAFGL